MSTTNVYQFQGMNADDMKAAYKRLVKKLHPDVNKSDTATRDMQILNGEFSYWYAISARDFVYNAKVAENPDKEAKYKKNYYSANYVTDLASAINALLNSRIYTCAAYDVEVIGVFVWIFGVGKMDKDIHAELKSIGFTGKMKWDANLKKSVYAWFYTPNYVPFSTNTSRQYMEGKYGAQKVYGNNGLNSGD